MNLTLILAIACPVLLVVIVYLVNRFSLLKIVNVANTIVDFVKSQLISNGWAADDNKFMIVLNYIAQALTEIQSSDSNKSPVELAADGVLLINSIAAKAQLTFTNEELEIIKTVLESGFVFVASLHLNASKIKMIGVSIKREAQ